MKKLCPFLKLAMQNALFKIIIGRSFICKSISHFCTAHFREKLELNIDTK